MKLIVYLKWLLLWYCKKHIKKYIYINKKKKKNISGLHSSLDVEYCLQNGAPFCDHSNLGFLEVTWWCGHRRTTPEMLCGVLLQCWDHVDRAWHTPLRLQARCWPSFLCRVILLSTMNITDDHCWMARPTCHLGHCRCARQCLAFKGVTQRSFGTQAIVVKPDPDGLIRHIGSNEGPQMSL